MKSRWLRSYVHGSGDSRDPKLEELGRSKKEMHNWVSILVSLGQEEERRKVRWPFRAVGPKKSQHSLLVSESRKL